MFKKIRNFFSKIVDHRVIGRTKFKLDDIIAIAFILTTIQAPPTSRPCRLKN
ncbi:MAG: hypothetical protein LBP92_04495 [Deltaproteobacteria bacterium]|nr:hypothetical protein [Deltaproteobacteria bacterium]